MKQKCIIFGIDGVLADCTHRLRLLPDYAAFHDEIHEDTPIRGCVLLARMVGDMRHAAGTKLYLVTGRPDTHSMETMQWLARNFVEYDNLYMRKADDSRPAPIVKDEIRQHLEKTHEIVLAIEDDPRNVAMWRAAGITTLQAEWDNTHRYGAGKLFMMVGPSGAGKDHILQGRSFAPSNVQSMDIKLWEAPVVSTDQIRGYLNNGDFREQKTNKQVFKIFHSLVKTYLEHGGNVVANATHLTRDSRMQTLAHAHRNSKIEYIVIDRPLEEKHRDAGWRSSIEVKGKPLVEYHHDIFQANLKDILAGDNDPRVTVRDLRSK